MAKGASSNLGRAQQVPRAAEDHDGQRPEIRARTSGERGVELAQVEHKDGGVERHVKDAGGEREPAFLVSPERAETAAHPDVEAAFSRDGCGEFADHEGGGQAPEQRQGEQDNDGAGVSGAAEDIFDAVGTAGNHEVGGGNQGQEADLAQGGIEDKAHECE
jgi:hypothetical protein